MHMLYNLMIEQIWESFAFGQLIISWREIVLTLKRNFNTAHSSSTQRHNFIVKIQTLGMKNRGYGQCGLPPKKPFCYYADINDCKQFMSRLREQVAMLDLSNEREKVEQYLINIFQGIPGQYFRLCRYQALKDSNKRQLLQEMVILLFWSRKTSKKPEYLASHSALEFSLFDCWSKLLQTSLPCLIFPSDKLEKAKPCCSFYTISYEQHSQMLENTLQGIKFTTFIKLKYIDDISNLLALLHSLEKHTEGQVKKYIIDANASWSVKSCRNFIQAIALQDNRDIKNKILYLQQPFGVNLAEEQVKQWEGLAANEVVKIVADQSCSSWQQLESIRRLCCGVNIKTEKAGGVINSLRTALMALDMKLQVMLGSMVSTHLGSTQTYCLHPLTGYLDVDGALLVKEPQVRGGFIWGLGGYLKCPETLYFGTEIETSIFDK